MSGIHDQKSASSSRTLNPSLVAGIVAVAALVATFAAFVGLKRADAARIRQQFHAEVDAIVASFERELRLSFESLYAVGNAFARDSQGMDEFADIAARTTARQAGIEALAWAGWDPDAAGLADDTCYVHPEGATRVCDADVLAAHPDWADAIARASVSGQVATSSAFPLTLDRGDVKARKRFLAFLPIRKTGIAATAGSDPAATLAGLAIGDFRVGELFARALEVQGTGAILLSLVDESAPIDARIVYRSAPASTEGGEGLNYRYTLALADIGGRDWRVEARPSLDYVARRRSEVPLVVLIAGALLAGFVFVYLRALLGRQRVVEALVAERTAELDAANRRLDQLARVDPLTGLANRRAFDDALKTEWKRAQREEASLALLMIDVDDFKAYNDSLGHSAGDRCLQSVAVAIRDAFRRAGDLAARYGGEEFAVILPATDRQALTVAERCLQAVRDLNLAHPVARAADRVTISVGVATMQPEAYVDLNPAVLIDRADAALYRAKAAGRNRVVPEWDDAAPSVGQAERA